MCGDNETLNKLEFTLDKGRKVTLRKEKGEHYYYRLDNQKFERELSAARFVLLSKQLFKKPDFKIVRKRKALRRKTTRRPRVKVSQKNKKESAEKNAEKAEKVCDQHISIKGFHRLVNSGKTIINDFAIDGDPIAGQFVYRTKLYSYINKKKILVGVVTTDGRGDETKIRINYTPAYSRSSGRKTSYQLSYRNKNQVPAALNDIFGKA